ncbi:MAG: bifunctional DNA-formamidopyrimidine glycosylase/DNA-(apurinic or apyrimidinic site) lyase [Planctomycetes bacterium]|nr:bifunctional DNA-formamidopyrimidine glycosylase/DNA-(apurinic or apyrimidinic site) lyase [Planctomycetota bacterium]
MPELPEVETVVRLIRPKLVGRTITGAEVHWRRTVVARAFEERVVGARIVAVRRRAKYIVVDLARRGRCAGAILAHLRMTGRMHVEKRAVESVPYAKVELALDDGRVLHFVDVRKFGRFEFTADVEARLARIGPEPLEEEFTAAWLQDGLRARRRLLKPLLLDQSFVAGLGNIYVDEALHRAGLHPLARSERVNPEQSARLRAEIRAVLAEAIEREGSSFDTFYRTPEGNPGGYQDQFRVYGRDGKPCRACGTTIVRLVVGQRGTHVCTVCQPRRAQSQKRRARDVSSRASSKRVRTRAPAPTAASTSKDRA